MQLKFIKMFQQPKNLRDEQLFKLLKDSVLNLQDSAHHQKFETEIQKSFFCQQAFQDKNE
ncbi:unnamed protein product [Paramecium sonneborni]|uniref:Uncharacterized protein n=1 Tax=Paramecium sonneborni TaxID=65129 RepID=A0A8S1RVH3_9CILI|nr:unnamed protein product [Paramecium sonneborni]